MTESHDDYQIDPKLDLVLERTVDVPVDAVWRAWTIPANVERWFTPAPWRTTDCEIDLRPGGVFKTVMRGPQGEVLTNVGCFLEVVPNRKLVWTSALLPGYRPAGGHPAPTNEGCGELLMTARILMTPAGAGTRYTAIVLHGNAEDRKRHEEMGFHAGWGTALDQLIAAARHF